MERKKTARRRTLRLGALGALVAMAVVAVMAVSADDAAACKRRALNGSIRHCTIMENFGQCIRDTEDAYWQCRRRHPGFWGAIRCSLANNIDQAGCVLGSGAFAVATAGRRALGA